MCDVRARSRENRNVLETHDRGRRKEDRKAECVRKEERILKCVAPCRCSVKVAQEKVAGLYTPRSSHEKAEHDG